MTGGTFEPAGGPMPAPRNNGLAIASLVLGGLGLLTCGFTALFGLIAGIIATGQIRRSNGQQKGQSLAAAGMAVSAFCLVMIPVFAAILFPVFAKARQRAKQSVCMHNVQQLSAAARAYAADYEETLPPARGWDKALQPGVRTREAWDCPEAGEGQGGYAYNIALSGLSARRVADFGRVPMQFDARGGGHPAGGWAIAEARHDNRCVIGFMDGHVQAVREEQLNGPGIQWTPALNR